MGQKCCSGEVSLAVLESVDHGVRPVDRMRSFYVGTTKCSVKWRLYAGGLWYEPPVNIEHAKETSEVFDQGRPLETVQLKLCSRGKSPPSRQKHIWLDSTRHIIADGQVLLVLFLRGRGD